MNEKEVYGEYVVARAEAKERAMSKIVQFYAVDEAVEHYREHKEEAIAVVEEAGIPSNLFDEEASRIDALELACAIIALAG